VHWKPKLQASVTYRSKNHTSKYQLYDPRSFWLCLFTLGQVEILTLKRQFEKNLKYKNKKVMKEPNCYDK
jgi:hypothetical protein